MGFKGGSGGTDGVDGYDHIGMIDASGGVLDQDYEMFEQQTPHLLLEHEFWQDSAGAGKYRGGLGILTKYKVGGTDTKLVTFGDGDVEPAFGLFGGKDATLNKIELWYPDGTKYQTTTKDLIEDVPENTIVAQEAGGGGGYGDPLERAPNKVQEEVKNGIISIDQAKDIYGIVLDPETLEVNEEESNKLRK
jgi:N-methylhydantoinase B